MEKISHSGLEVNLVVLELRVKWNDVQNLKKLQEKICAVAVSDYKDQSKQILNDIGIKNESSDSDADFESSKH